MVSRETARSQSKTTGHVLSYEEIIEEQDAVAFLEELDVRFEVPDEVASSEAYRKFQST